MASPTHSSTSLPRPLHSSNPGSKQGQSQPTAPLPAAPSHHTTSETYPGSSARPRDARLLHLVLANAGVAAYQDRVPVQLMDFAYRYTSSVLTDSWGLVANGYGLNKVHRGGIPGTSTMNPTGNPSNPSTTASSGGGGAGGASGNPPPIDGSHMTVSAIRLAIASRPNVQFSSAGLSRDWWLDLAAERNRVALPRMDESKSYGVRLPHERHCLTGVGWRLKDEWESDEEELDDGSTAPDGLVIDIDHEMDDVDMDRMSDSEQKPVADPADVKPEPTEPDDRSGIANPDRPAESQQNQDTSG